MSNTNTIRSVFKRAIGTGELITAIYTLGSRPGAKRRLLPIKVTDELIYAKRPPEAKVKTYRINHLELCEDSCGAQWYEDYEVKRSKNSKVDPKAYFADWVYSIGSHFWSALGVCLNEYIDSDRTKIAREDAKQNGRDPKKVAIKYLAHSVSKPPSLDFHVGDFFHSNTNNSLQIVSIRDFIEVHIIPFGLTGKVDGYHVIDTELAEWLKSGKAPQQARITPADSYSEIHRFNITDPFKKDELWP